MRIDIGQYHIRDWNPDDSIALVEHANNRNISDNMRDGFAFPYTLSDASDFLTSVIKHSPRTIFAVATVDEAIGSIGLMMGRDVHRFTAELGYWLSESLWGRGIMTSAVIAITNFAFREFTLNRIFAEPYSTNPASYRVLEKAGFECEGTMRANVVKNGRILDQMLYAKIRDGVE